MLLLDLVSFDHCQEVCYFYSVPGPRGPVSSANIAGVQSEVHHVRTSNIACLHAPPLLAA